MVKNGEETAKKEGKTTGNVLPVLLGTGTGLVLLLLLTLLAAGLIWSGVLPVSIAGMSLTIAAGLCALVGGRVAVNRGSGGSLPMEAQQEAFFASSWDWSAWEPLEPRGFMGSLWESY